MGVARTMKLVLNSHIWIIVVCQIIMVIELEPPVSYLPFTKIQLVQFLFHLSSIYVTSSNENYSYIFLLT